MRAVPVLRDRPEHGEVISELYTRIGESSDGVWTVFLLDSFCAAVSVALPVLLAGTLGRESPGGGVQGERRHPVLPFPRRRTGGGYGFADR